MLKSSPTKAKAFRRAGARLFVFFGDDVFEFFSRLFEFATGLTEVTPHLGDETSAEENEDNGENHEYFWPTYVVKHVFLR